MIMLFHDAVTIGVKGAHEKMLPFGPPPRFEEVLANPNAGFIVCKPCLDVRGMTEDILLAECKVGGMNDYHAHVSREDGKAVSF